MCTLLTNKRYELLYNCGIQLLHIGRPLAAFECLIEAVQVYHSNPRLWLRIAECCIAANKGVRISFEFFLIQNSLKTHQIHVVLEVRHIKSVTYGTQNHQLFGFLDGQTEILVKSVLGNYF